MSITYTARQIAEAAEKIRRVKGVGHCPPPDDCVALARAGHLFAVDAGPHGGDTWVEADSHADALNVAAEGAGRAQVPPDWTVQAVEIVGDQLADQRPDAVGREAVELVLSRLARLHVPLSPGVELSYDGGRTPEGRALPPEPLSTDLALTVAQLTRWAQGGSLGDWADHDDAADALQTAAEALCASPLRPWQVADLDAAVALPRGAEPGPVALVLACALSRLRICRGEPVTLVELARLASVADSRVRQLAAAGELRSAIGSGPKGSTVEAAEARRWLASRGLAGW